MIDYNLINKSIDFYETCGFERIEVPWIVSGGATEVTQASDDLDYNKKYRVGNSHKTLVASGEQSFIELMMKHQLPDGMYQTVTPCFRNDQVDMIHRKQFLKNELIMVGDYKDDDLSFIMSCAIEFFKSIGINKVKEEVHNYWYKDLDFLGHELGSYGVRKNSLNQKWVYGTGLAEPRTSTLMDFYGISQETDS